MEVPTPVEESEAQDALPRTDFNLEQELEELHEFVRAGTGFMNHAVWLDLEEFETRIRRIMTHLPKEVKRARRVTREEQQILQEAKNEASRTISEARSEAEELIAAARAEAERLVEASSIQQAAVSQAEAIVQRAQGTAEEIRQRAFTYGRDVLATLQATVDQTREQIIKGQEELGPPS